MSATVDRYQRTTPARLTACVSSNRKYPIVSTGNRARKSKAEVKKTTGNSISRKPLVSTGNGVRRLHGATIASGAVRRSKRPIVTTGNGIRSARRPAVSTGGGIRRGKSVAVSTGMGVRRNTSAVRDTTSSAVVKKPVVCTGHGVRAKQYQSPVSGQSQVGKKPPQVATGHGIRAVSDKPATRLSMGGGVRKKPVVESGTGVRRRQS
jgi:hypothetical protein